MRLGIILPSGLGDVVMATPALRALRKHVGAEGQLIGFMRPSVAPVLAGGTWFDETVCYGNKNQEGTLHGKHLRRRLQEAKLDAMVLLDDSLRTAWLAWRSASDGRRTASLAVI